MELTERDRELFQLMLDVWGEADYPTLGHQSYQDVFDLCDKMGVKRPQFLVDLCEAAERTRKKWQR